MRSLVPGSVWPGRSLQSCEAPMPAPPQLHTGASEWSHPLPGRWFDGIRIAPRAEPTGRSDAIQAFTNAVWGDELARRGSAMAIEMGVRDRFGRVVEPEAGALAQSFPDASSRIAVLIHGLGQTERCFARGGPGQGLDGRDRSLFIHTALCPLQHRPHRRGERRRSLCPPREPGCPVARLRDRRRTGRVLDGWVGRSSCPRCGTLELCAVDRGRASCRHGCDAARRIADRAKCCCGIAGADGRTPEQATRAIPGWSQCRHSGSPLRGGPRTRTRWHQTPPNRRRDHI